MTVEQPYSDPTPDGETGQRIRPRTSAIRAIDAIFGAEERGPVEISLRPKSGLGVGLSAYRVFECVGQGGGGSVHRAMKAGGIEVAMKFIALEAGNPEDLARAEREADLLAGARTHALPYFHEAFPDGSRFVIVTDFIHGVPIDVATATDSLASRMRVLARFARAVQSLHDENILHRDLKPANVLVDAAGEVRLLDLGISRGADWTRSPMTRSIRAGTPEFMSPEQAAGDLESARTDVYGIAATAVAVLTGEPPSQPVVPRSPVRGAGVMRRLPSAVRSILECGLAEQSLDRYASASELADDIERWLIGEPVVAATGTIRRRLTSSVERNPIRWFATANAILASAILGGALLGLTLASRGAYVERDALGRFARVISPYGLDVARFEGNGDGTIVAADSMSGPVNPLAWIAFGRTRASDQGSLRVVCLRQPGVVLGEHPGNLDLTPMPVGVPTGVGQSDDNLSITAIRAGAFGFGAAGCDFIVARQLHPSSQSLIQGLSFDPRTRTWGTRFEFWYDGAVLDVQWSAAHARLFVVALCSEGTLGGRGYVPADDDLADSTARVVFAVNIDAVPTEAKWLRVPGGVGFLEPEWFRVVEPVVGLAESGADLRFEPATPEYDSHDAMRLSVLFPADPELEAAVFFDANGTPLPAMRYAGTYVGSPIELGTIRKIGEPRGAADSTP